MITLPVYHITRALSYITHAVCYITHAVCYITHAVCYITRIILVGLCIFYQHTWSIENVQPSCSVGRWFIETI